MQTAKFHFDPLLAAISCQVGVGCLANSKKPSSKRPVCSADDQKKSERIIVAMKESNTLRGCKVPEGNGSKKCPNVYAVTTKIMKCRVEAAK